MEPIQLWWAPIHLPLVSCVSLEHMATELGPLHASPVIGDTTAQTMLLRHVPNVNQDWSQLLLDQPLQMHAHSVLLARYLEIISVL